MSTVDRSTRLIFTETKEYPVYLSDLSTRIRDTIFPSKVEDDELLPFGYEVVNLVPRPTADFITEGAPELIEGTWYQTWTTRSYSLDEQNQHFSSAKSSTLASIEAFRVNQFEKGFPYQFGDEIYHVQIRTTDRQNISSIRVIAKEAIVTGNAFPINFRVYENITVSLTAEEFVTLADTTFARVSEGYQVAWELKDQTERATVSSEFPTIPTDLFATVEAFARA